MRGPFKNMHSVKTSGSLEFSFGEPKRVASATLVNPDPETCCFEDLGSQASIQIGSCGINLIGLTEDLHKSAQTCSAVRSQASYLSFGSIESRSQSSNTGVQPRSSPYISVRAKEK